MHWLNEPSKWQAQDQTIAFNVERETDFWRKTHDGGMRDNGHFYSDTVTGDFAATVKVIGNYHALYDQAGMMVRLDESVWLKCGIEYMDGVQYASAVVTRDYSDWSIVSLSPSPDFIALRVTRHRGTLAVYYAPPSGEFQMIRQAHLTTAETLQVGVMAAAPKGPGFAVTFEDFAVQPAN